MTIDEAIEELRDASDSEVRYGDTEHHYDEVMKRVEALDMAIKALETASCIKEKCAYCPHCEHCDVDDETLAIKNMRYKPVILQEHDAEPRRLNAILDTKTKEVYVRAALTGFTIEEVER